MALTRRVSLSPFNHPAPPESGARGKAPRCLATGHLEIRPEAPLPQPGWGPGLLLGWGMSLRGKLCPAPQRVRSNSLPRRRARSLRLAGY